MKVVRPAASKRAQRTCTGGSNSSVAVTSAPVPVSPRSGLFFCASSLPVIFSTPATRPTICARAHAPQLSLCRGLGMKMADKGTRKQQHP